MGQSSEESAIFDGEGVLSPPLLSPAAQAFIDDIESTLGAVQTFLIPTADGGVGDSPQGSAAWYPDIQPFNISQAIKLTPGYGDSTPQCGTVRYFETCPEHQEHHARPVFYRDHRKDCPVCWPSWANRQGQKASERIEGYQAAHRHHYDARHIDISPDQETIPYQEACPEALQWLYNEGSKIARILGLTAAAVIPHPYRLRPETKEAVQEAAQAAGMNRYEYALGQPNWSDLVYFSPHLHLLAYGRLMDTAQFNAKRTGWQYHNHDEDQHGRHGLDLRKTVYYLLSHSWVNGNSKVVRYWFGMSTHRLTRVDEGYEKMPVVCPVCSAPCIANPPDTVRTDGTTLALYQDLHNAPPALRKVLYFRYEVRAPKPRQKPSATLFQGVIA